MKDLTAQMTDTSECFMQAAEMKEGIIDNGIMNRACCQRLKRSDEFLATLFSLIISVVASIICAFLGGLAWGRGFKHGSANSSNNTVAAHVERNRPGWGRDGTQKLTEIRF